MGTNFPICCAPAGFAVQAMLTARRRIPTRTFSRRMDASQANLVRGRLQMQFAQILAPPAPQRKQIRARTSPTFHSEAAAYADAGTNIVLFFFSANSVLQTPRPLC